MNALVTGVPTFSYLRLFGNTVGENRKHPKSSKKELQLGTILHLKPLLATADDHPRLYETMLTSGPSRDRVVCHGVTL